MNQQRIRELEELGFVWALRGGDGFGGDRNGQLEPSSLLEERVDDRMTSMEAVPTPTVPQPPALPPPLAPRGSPLGTATVGTALEVGPTCEI